MTTRFLPVLEDTDYLANVYRDGDGDLFVRVTRPSRDLAVDELIGDRLLYAATETALETTVREIIATDTPNLVGTYTGKKETE